MRIWRKELMQEPVLLVTLMVAVFLSSIFVSAMPRLFDVASRSDLQQSIVDAEPEQRNIRAETTSRFGAGPVDDPLRLVSLKGEELRREALPSLVEQLVDEQLFVVDSPPFKVSSFPDQVVGPFPTTFRFRFQDGVEDELAVQHGTMPSVRESIAMLSGPECSDTGLVPEGFERDGDIDCGIQQVPVYETALSTQTAADMQVGVGDMFILTPDSVDSHWRFGGWPQDLRLIVVVSGIVELTDASLEYWFADSALHRPRITENSDFRLIGAVGLVRPDRYGQLVRDLRGIDNDYTWRFLVEPTLIEPDQAERLLVELAKVSASDAQISTGLPDLLREFVAQRNLTLSLLSSVTVSLLAVTIAVVTVVALLIGDRLRYSTALLVDRGASRGRQLGSAWLTAVLVVLPTAGLGWLVGWRLFPETAHTPSLRAVGVFLVVSISVIFLSLRPLRSFASADQHDRLTRRLRRVMIEVALVGVAIGAVALLRRRSLNMEAALLERRDPLLVVTPLLVMASASVVMARLWGPAMNGAARLVSRRRGLVGFFSMRRVASLGLSARTPVLAVLVAVAVSGLSSTIAASIGAAQREQALVVVGSDYLFASRRGSLPLPPSIDPAQLDPGATWAFGTRFFDLRIDVDTDRGTADVVAVDAAAYGTMLSTSGRDSSVFDVVGAASLELEDATIPVAISPRLFGDVQPQLGDSFEIRIDGTVVPATVVMIADDVVGLAGAPAGIIADLSALGRFVDARLVQPRFVHVDAPSSVLPAVERMAAANVSVVRFLSRPQVLHEIAGDPFGQWTARVLWIVAGGAAAYGVVAVAAGVAMSAAARRRDDALLRTMGMSRAQATRMAAIEQVPVVVVATMTGMAGGIGVADLLAPALDLGVFAGGIETKGIVVDPMRTAALACTLLAVLLLALIATEFQHRSVDGATILRVGEEG